MRQITQYVEHVPLGPGRPSVRVTGTVGSEEEEALVTVEYAFEEGRSAVANVRLSASAAPAFLEALRAVVAKLEEP